MKIVFYILLVCAFVILSITLVSIYKSADIHKNTRYKPVPGEVWKKYQDSVFYVDSINEAKKYMP